MLGVTRGLHEAEEDLSNEIEFLNGERYVSGRRCTKEDMMLRVHTKVAAGTKQ